MFGKIIGKLFGAMFLAVVLAALVIPGYFWYKSGQPMQVAEAQSRVPGLTFREFWASRVTQWQKWDDELRAAGENDVCVDSGYTMLVLRSIVSIPFVIDLRLHQQDAEYTSKRVNYNNGIVPPDNLLYQSGFVDAWWSMIEHSSWAEYSHDPGFPVKELNQRRACSTTYPTEADHQP